MTAAEAVMDNRRMVTKKTKGLGLGLEALLGPKVNDAATAGDSAPSTLRLELLLAGKYQPRTRMDEGSLYELAVLLVPVKAEFGLSDLQVGLVTGLGFALTFGLIGVPLGRVADRRERRTLVAWCRGIGGALAALGATASGAWTLAFTRMGGAISDAGGGPASMSMIADLYPPESRSRAMSVFAMGASAGSLMATLRMSAVLLAGSNKRTASAASGNKKIHERGCSIIRFLP